MTSLSSWIGNIQRFSSSSKTVKLLQSDNWRRKKNRSKRQHRSESMNETNSDLRKANWGLTSSRSTRRRWQTRSSASSVSTTISSRSRTTVTISTNFWTSSKTSYSRWHSRSMTSTRISRFVNWTCMPLWSTFRRPVPFWLKTTLVTWKIVTSMMISSYRHSLRMCNQSSKQSRGKEWTLA